MLSESEENKARLRTLKRFVQERFQSLVNRFAHLPLNGLTLTYSQLFRLLLDDIEELQSRGYVRQTGVDRLEQRADELVEHATRNLAKAR